MIFGCEFDLYDSNSNPFFNAIPIVLALVCYYGQPKL